MPKRAPKLPKQPEDLEFSGIHFDYERDRSNCKCGGYCRCSTISNVTLSSIDLSEIAKELKEKTNIKSNGFEKLLFDIGANKASAWAANISRGYYGQEVNSASLGDKEIEKLKAGIQQMIDKPSADYSKFDFTKTFPKPKEPKTFEERLESGDFMITYDKDGNEIVR